MKFQAPNEIKNTIEAKIKARQERALERKRLCFKDSLDEMYKDIQSNLETKLEMLKDSTEVPSKVSVEFILYPELYFRHYLSLYPTECNTTLVRDSLLDLVEVISRENEHYICTAIPETEEGRPVYRVVLQEV